MFWEEASWVQSITTSCKGTPPLALRSPPAQFPSVLGGANEVNWLGDMKNLCLPLKGGCRSR